MSEFELSAPLVKRIFSNLIAEALEEDISVPEDAADSIDFEIGRKSLGKTIMHYIASCAQEARYQPSLSFAFIKNGSFPTRIDEALGGRLSIPPGQKGNVLMAEVAQEFIAWATSNDSKDVFPRGPVTKVVAEGNTLIFFVKPPEPAEVDPNFVRATRVE